MSKAKLGGMASVLDIRAAVQGYLKKIEEWINRNTVNSSKDICEIFLLKTEHHLTSGQVGNRLFQKGAEDQKTM